MQPPITVPAARHSGEGDKDNGDSRANHIQDPTRQVGRAMGAGEVEKRGDEIGGRHGVPLAGLRRCR